VTHIKGSLLELFARDHVQARSAQLGAAAIDNNRQLVAITGGFHLMESYLLGRGTAIGGCPCKLGFSPNTSILPAWDSGLRVCWTISGHISTKYAQESQFQRQSQPSTQVARSSLITEGLNNVDCAFQRPVAPLIFYPHLHPLTSLAGVETLNMAPSKVSGSHPKHSRPNEARSLIIASLPPCQSSKVSTPEVTR
jgi:hypothetical protein